MAIVSDITNLQFESALAAIAARQSKFFSTHGRYEQLVTLEGTGISNPIGATVTVDVYEGPEGHGYVVVGSTVVDKVQYQRRSNVGPESYRTSNGWALKPLN